MREMIDAMVLDKTRTKARQEEIISPPSVPTSPSQLGKTCMVGGYGLIKKTNKVQSYMRKNK